MSSPGAVSALLLARLGGGGELWRQRRAGANAALNSPHAIADDGAMDLRTVTATRYVTPLREGGSLPAIVEADDSGMYVLKFRGAGQGARALIAELVAGEIARALGLPVPEIVFVELDAELARTEPDPEIQHLIRASTGINLALDYLPGSVTFDALVEHPDADLASRIVWFDAYVSNVDRTVRNTNMLVWHRRLQLIDHGAALYFHHSWFDQAGDGYLERSSDPFLRIKDHVLLPAAGALAAVDADMAARLSAQLIADIVALIPDAWLDHGAPFANVVELREAYLAYLTRRLAAPRAFVAEAIRARESPREAGRNAG
jgi:HipA-like kinase